MFKLIKAYFLCSVLIGPYMYADPPSWTVDPGGYSGSASATAMLFLNDSLVGDGNIVGAFVNDTCRGVASPEYYQNSWIYFITIYGNENGDTVHFRAWITGSDTVLNIWETIVYEYNSVFGSPDDPFALNTYLDHDFHPLLAGIPDQTVEVGTGFDQIDLTEYLTTLDEHTILWGTDGENVNLSVGIVSGIASVTPLLDTWVGSEPVVFIATDDTQNGYSDSDTVLFEILPTDHEPDLAGIPDQTIGIFGEFLDIDLNEYLTELDGDSLRWSVLFNDPAVTDAVPSWEVNPADFELSMSATIMVESNEILATGTENILAAFSMDGAVRGLSSATEYVGSWVYFLTIYSNSNEDTISFRFYDAGIAQDLPVLETVQFSNNDVLGAPDTPMMFHAGNILVDIGNDGVASLNLIDELWTGNETINFIVEDIGTLNGHSSSDEVSLTVLADYAPVISGVPDQSVELGTSFSPFELSDFVEIYDQDEVLFSVAGEMDLDVTLSGADGGNVTIAPLSETWVGSDSVIFTVTDNTENGFMNSDTALFEVRPLDTAPSISGIEDQTIVIGQEFEPMDLNSYLIESDGDSVLWEFEFLPYPVTIDDPAWSVQPSEYEFSMTVTAHVISLGYPAIGQNHSLAAVSEDGTVRGVCSATEYLDHWLYFLTIYSNTNGTDLELLFYDYDSERILQTLEGLTFVSDSQEGSPDDPYQVHAGPTLVWIDDQENFLFQTIEPIWQYSEVIRFTVQDQGTVNQYSSSYDMTIMMNNDPATVDLDAQIINEGSNFDPIDLRSVINDNWSPFDSLTISVSDEGVFEISIVLDTLVIEIPDTNWFGQNNITFEIFDTHPYVPVVSQVEVPFIVENVNDFPEIADISDQEIDEDTSLDLNLDGSDIDNDSLLFHGSVISGEVDTEILGSVLRVTPHENWNGTSVIEVTIDDQSGGYDTTQFSLVVNQVNDAPFSYVDSLSLFEDGELSFVLSGSDIDTDDSDLVFTVISGPETGWIDVDSSAVIYQPELNWFGSVSLSYLVHDGLLFSDTGYVYIEVVPVNDTPTAILTNSALAMQEQTIIIDGSGSYDIDNDPIDYDWEVPFGFSNNSEDGSSIALTVPIMDSGSIFTIVLSVSDGSLVSEPDTMLLTVSDLSVDDILPSFEGSEVGMGEELSIEVTIPDIFDIDSISLNYTNGVSDFVSIEMTEGASRSSSFSADIDASMVGLEGLAYYVFAQDSIGNTIRTDTASIQVSFGSGTVSSSMDHSPFMSGLLNDSWRIISAPSDLDDRLISNIFSIAMNSEPSETEWMIYEWSGSEWVIPTTVIPGKGYWIKQIKYDRADFSLGSGSTIDLTGFDISLDSGWNLISSPYLFPVSVGIDEQLFSEIYYYDGKGWADTLISDLLPWSGYAIFNHSDSPEYITLNPLNMIEENMNRSILDDGWMATMKVSGTNYFDHKNEFGMNKEAKNDFDRRDCPEPPAVDEYVSLYSISGSGDIPYNKLTKDLRSLDDSLQVWDLVLEMGVRDHEVTIDIEVDGDLNPFELWFLDLQERQATQLVPGVAFTSDIDKANPGMMYDYKLIFGGSDDVGRIMDSVLGQIPERFLLRNNYPNPFNPLTTIPFDVSIPSHVSIAIYDIGGRMVDMVTNEFWPTGFHRVQWNGRNSNGQLLSTGVYLVRMETKDHVQYKKMIFLK